MLNSEDPFDSDTTRAVDTGRDDREDDEKDEEEEEEDDEEDDGGVREVELRGRLVDLGGIGRML